MKNIRITSKMKNIFKHLSLGLICLMVCHCNKNSDPQPTLENSDYTGEPRIVILSNSISISSISGYGFAGNTYKFTVRAQSKEGLLVVGTDIIDNSGNIINEVSASESSSGSGSNNTQENFSNINITDYTGSFTLTIPANIKDSIKVRAVLIDKAEHREYAYFTIYVKIAPLNLYFNINRIPGDSITTIKVNATTSTYLYLMAETQIMPISITYECYKRSTGVSLAEFPQKAIFSTLYSGQYFYDNISIITKDTGIYILKAYANTSFGSTDTAYIIINSQPPKAMSDYDIVGAQNNTVFGISYYLNGGTSTYKDLNKYPSSKSTFTYVYDNDTSYLVSLYERKNSHIYDDSIPANTQNTSFIELNLPVASYDTISGNYIFNMIIPSSSPGKISISTSKLIGYMDADKTKGVLKISSIATGTTGSINFSTRYQYKLDTQ